MVSGGGGGGGGGENIRQQQQQQHQQHHPGGQHGIAASTTFHQPPNPRRHHLLHDKRSQSSTSIPAVYSSQGQGTSGQGYPLYYQDEVEGDSRPSRRVPPGPGHYHRTLSSSSLLSNHHQQIQNHFYPNKSSTPTSTITTTIGYGRGSPTSSPQRVRNTNNHPNNRGGGGGGTGGRFYPPPYSRHPGSGSNIHIFEEPPEEKSFQPRGRFLPSSNSQPIITVHVPITAPKATATTLSRATSPTPPRAVTTGSPKLRKKPTYQSHEEEEEEEEEEDEVKVEEEEDEVLQVETDNNDDPVVPEPEVSKKAEETKILMEDPQSQPVPIPAHLVKYLCNAPLKKIKHPLEENIFTSLFITLVAVGVAILIGIPILLGTGGIFVASLVLRYSFVILHGCYSWLRYHICSRTRRAGQRQSHTGPSSTPPHIFPRDRLAFANDVRWLGRRKDWQCQSVLQTLLVFDGNIDLLNLRNLVQSRVIYAETPEGELAYPRLMQKLTRLSLGIGYRWELDPQFDIGNHIYSVTDSSSSDIQVQDYLGLLLQEELPLSKPLWEIRVIPQQKDTLAILRVHQCLADGMTLVRILSHSLADHAQMHIPQRPHFAGLSFGFNVIRSLIVGPLTFLMWIGTTWRDKNLLSIPLVNQKKKVKRKKKQRRKRKKGKRSHITPQWNVVWSAPVSVPKVARVKQIMRSSLNDVLLAAAAGSVRVYMQNQGIPCPGDIKVVIPIDLRNDISSPKSSTKLGCKVASVLATIPSGMEGAIPRLWAIRHRLDELKASADPVVAYGATTILMNILPHPLGVAVLDNIADKASLQFSNLPGPTHTLVVGGYPIKGIYPIYPPSGKIKVAISVFSYADQVHLTVVAHKSLTHAGPTLLQGITAQVDQLSKQLSHRRVPGESRRSMRNASMNNPEIQKPPTKQIHIQLQVVQEELQQLSKKMEEPEEDEGENYDEQPSGLRTKLQSLKTEFTELMGELRRRSSIVEGIPMSFEDEECEDDFRKPIRKRALSVVSIGARRRDSLFKSMMTPENSSGCGYPSDNEEEEEDEDEKDLPSSPAGGGHYSSSSRPSTSTQAQTQQQHLQRSPMKTTAV